MKLLVCGTRTTKCPNAYFDSNLQQCACGQGVADTVIVKEITPKIVYLDKEGKEIAKENLTKEIKEGLGKVEITTKENKNFIFNKEIISGVKSSEKEIKTDGNISLKSDKVYLNDKEVKIMPDTASQKAISTLMIKKDITIELKDTGKPVYGVNGKKEVRLFGLFEKDMLIKSKIDGTTGEIISVDRPWWSFLAR